MPTTNQSVSIIPLAPGLSSVVATATFSAAADVSNWVRMTRNVTVQASGPVTAATVAVERSTIDPASGTNNAAELGDITGNPSVGMSGNYTVNGIAWYRMKNKATFGPAATIQERSLASLAAAINGRQPAANGFAPGTAPQPLVSAVQTGATMVLTAATPGTAGNAITTTETMANGSFGGATLSGGVNAVAASGSLTFATAAAADGNTVTIDTTVYTFRTALTVPNVANEVLAGASLTASRDNLVRAVNRTGTGATGTITFTGVGTDQSTVRIGDVTYTLVAALSATTPNQVLIGATLTDTRNNLLAAISSGAGAGTAYSNFTAPHPQVTAAAVSTDAITVTAREIGMPGNIISTLFTGTGASWGAAQMSGATGPGVSYGTPTVAHTSVSAAPSSTNVLVATALATGTAGNAIATTEVGPNTSWGAATLGSGANAVAATGTLTLTGNPGAAETVVVGGTTYTFRTSLTPTAGEILIAGTTADFVMIGGVDLNVF